MIDESFQRHSRHTALLPWNIQIKLIIKYFFLQLCFYIFAPADT